MSESNINFFLDTTIQIDRRLAEPQKLGSLEKSLKQAKYLSTSTYVKMEYRRSLVQDWVYIYNTLCEVEDFGEILFRIKKLSHYSQRRMSRMLGSLAWLFLDGPKDISELKGKELKEIALHYFKSIIEYSIDDFDDNIDLILNETDCFNAKAVPTFMGEKFDNRTVRCMSSDVKCRIIEFFNLNINDFKKIYEELSSLPELDEEQDRMKHILEKALQHPHNMSYYKNCWRCADAIIAVECPQEDILSTTNEKHFKPICNKIKKKLAIFKY